MIIHQKLNFRQCYIHIEKNIINLVKCGRFRDTGKPISDRLVGGTAVFRSSVRGERTGDILQAGGRHHSILSNEIRVLSTG